MARNLSVRASHSLGLIVCRRLVFCRVISGPTSTFVRSFWNCQCHLLTHETDCSINALTVSIGRQLFYQNLAGATFSRLKSLINPSCTRRGHSSSVFFSRLPTSHRPMRRRRPDATELNHADNVWQPIWVEFGLFASGQSEWIGLYFCLPCI